MSEYRRHQAGRLATALTLAAGIALAHCPLVLAHGEMNTGATGTYQHVPSGPIAGVTNNTVTVNAPALTVNGNITTAGVTSTGASAVVAAASAAHVPDADADITSGMVNQTYNQLAPGNYYNTENGATVFQNNSSLHLQSGTMHGFEVGAAAGGYATTGNGGSFVLNAPVVRLDGNIDVSGFVKNGAMGNGGNVTINSAFLYQNGQIFANGANGGTVQANVGAMTMGDGARTEAIGTNGEAGQVNINATGAVNIARGAVIDASGAVIGSYDTNVIDIQGGLINLDGIVTASGFEVGQSAGVAQGQNGGVVNVVAKGNSQEIDKDALALAEAGGVFTAAEVSDLTTTDAQLRATADGDIQVGVDGRLTADGAAGYSGLNPNADPGDPATQFDVQIDGGTGGIVKMTAARDVVNNGRISANGGDGFTGYNPTNGGDAGLVQVNVARNLDNNALIAANGGHGGTNPDIASGPVVDAVDEHGDFIYDADGNRMKIQASFGQDGGNGGNAGAVLVFYGDRINNDGAIEAKGGNGGNGQIAVSDTHIDGFHEHVAYGGNGGNGGWGGYVEFVGGVGAKLPSQTTLNNINVDGGTGGTGGAASTLNDCGCAEAGADGGCGAPGQIKYRVDDIPPRPPENPPSPPPTGIALYPREYPRIGDSLPSNIGPVISYNRSIFLARAPLPVIKKRKPVPPKPEVTQIVSPPVLPAPKPAPPQKKTVVRGYW